MAVLRARLYEAERQRLASERGEERRLQVGSGERREKIRTYNYPQNRVTDHRVGLTLHKLEKILDGLTDDDFRGLKPEQVLELILQEYQTGG